jgi:uncharacterized protein (DUF2249 family)/hemerythrin-like domain-containing protein
MSSTETIDVRGLEHADREGLIFPNLANLTKGNELRIILEFNPVSLVYLLKAQNEFEVSYEKEGHPEWILKAKRIRDSRDTKAEFRTILNELRSDRVSEETKKKAKDFFAAVDAKTVGIMEQELIQEGVSHEEIRASLCDVHLEVLKDTLVAKRIEVIAPHPIHTLMEEHKIILKTLAKLREVLASLKSNESFQGFGIDLKKLQGIAHLLVETEVHHQREEEALFPQIEKHDITEPPSIMKMDHVEFRKRKKELYQLAHKADQVDFTTFKQKVLAAGEFIAKELESHIFKEDNILYQIALQVLSSEEWDRVKNDCDKIGYCCFTPSDQVQHDDIVELDLRPLPPFERHVKIFELWDQLKPGQTLRIINDHNPKPLRYQFEAEQKGKFDWHNDQEGPKDWVVRILRLKA